MGGKGETVNCMGRRKNEEKGEKNVGKYSAKP
jgi:hypothetical protein